MLRKIILVAGLISATSNVFAIELPSEEVRLKIFNQVVSELERIDGEGRPARKNRPEAWAITK